MEGDFRRDQAAPSLKAPKCLDLDSNGGRFIVSIIIDISLSGRSGLSLPGADPPSVPSRPHSAALPPPFLRGGAQRSSLARRSPPRRVDGLGARVAAWLSRKPPLFCPPRLGWARAGSGGGAEAGGRRHGLKSRGRKRAGESHEPAPGQPARQRAAVCRLQPGPRWGGGAGPGRAVAAGRCGAVRAAGGGAGRRFGGSARSARAVRAGWGPGPWAGLPLRWRSGLRFQRPFVERRVNPPPFGSEEGSAASESWLGAAGREERSALSVFPPPASISSSGGPSRRCAALPPSEPRCWESNAANVAFSAPALPTYSQRCNFVSDLRSRAANHIRGQTQDAADGWPASERFSCFICPLWEKGEALSTKGVRVPPFAFAMYK